MDIHNLNHAGAPVTQCSDEESCTVMSCEVCLQEIPADSVKQADAQDYIHHFCGLNCLETWQKRAGSHQKSERGTAS